MEHIESFLLCMCRYVSVCVCAKIQRYKAAVIQGSWHSFLLVSPYMMDASPTFRKALKNSCYLAIFLCHYSGAKNAKFIYHLSSCKSNLLMESVNKRWVQHPTDITATFMHMNKLHASSARTLCTIIFTFLNGVPWTLCSLEVVSKKRRRKKHILIQLSLAYSPELLFNSQISLFWDTEAKVSHGEGR